MHKVILDTNIFVSAIIFGGKPREVLRLIQKGKIEGFITSFIVSELKEVLRKKFDFSEEKLRNVEDLVTDDFIKIEPKVSLLVIKNYLADNKIIEAAVEADADYLITGDKKHLLRLKKYKKTKIVTAETFLTIINR